MLNYKKLDESEVEYIVVAAVDEVGDGERLVVDIGGEAIVVFRITGKYFAIADMCSHDKGPVSEGEVRGLEIECPRHGARYELETGKVLCLPAVTDIPAYPVRVEGGEIMVGLPLENG